MAPAVSRKLFVNLAVQDLDKSVEFFRSLGFEFNAQFTDEKAACMVLSEDGYVMLLVREFFTTFTAKDLCDPRTQVEGLFALTCESRDAVDDLVDKALTAGGKAAGEPQDHGFMYQRAFEDLDGHVWEIFWMDEAAVQQ